MQNRGFYRPLLALTSQTYWSRVWMVQEVLVSQERPPLMRQTFDLVGGAELRHHTGLFRRKRSNSPTRTSSAPFIGDRRTWYPCGIGTRNIVSLAVKFHTSPASGIRDKISALLGIADDAKHTLVDYDAPPQSARLQAIRTTEDTHKDALSATHSTYPPGSASEPCIYTPCKPPIPFMNDAPPRQHPRPTPPQNPPRTATTPSPANPVSSNHSSASETCPPPLAPSNHAQR